jgi:hypothetical protein
VSIFKKILKYEWQKSGWTREVRGNFASEQENGVAANTLEDIEIVFLP